MTTRRRFTAEFKARVALAALRGDRSIQEIATSILYQGALIMTHRDLAADASGQWAGRGEAAGDAGHRQGFPTPPPIRPLPVRLRDRNAGFPRLSGCVWL